MHPGESDPEKSVEDPGKRNTLKIGVALLTTVAAIGIGYKAGLFDFLFAEETPQPRPNEPVTPTYTSTPKPTATPKPTPVPILGYTIHEPGDASLEDITSYAHTVLFITANYEPDTKEYKDAKNLYSIMVWDVVNSDSVGEVHDKYVEVIRIFNECKFGPMSQERLDNLKESTWDDAEDFYNSKDKQGEANSWKRGSLDQFLGTKCKTT